MSTRLGSVRAWRHGHHARSSHGSRPRDRGRPRGRRHACLFNRHRPDTASAAPAKPAYGWPVKPFHAQHPVRGFFGDPRIGMTPKGMQSSFHFGIDISCPNGTPVYATLDGVARLESFRSETVAVIGRDGRTEFEYWHIRPAVRNGDRVTAYRTVVGWAAAPWEHVHFSERRDGVYLNPLRRGRARAVRGHDPAVAEAAPRRGGRPPDGRRARGPSTSSSRPTTTTPIPVPGRWSGKPVTPAPAPLAPDDGRGRVVRPWRSAIDHRLTIPVEGPVRDRVRTLDAPEQAQPPGPLSFRDRGRLGQPRRSPTAATSSRSWPPM